MQRNSPVGTEIERNHQGPLIIFDLDWTLFNEDCEFFIPKELGKDWFPGLEALYESEPDPLQFRNNILARLHREGKRREHFEETLERIPFDENIKKALEYCLQKQAELHILSDNNSTFLHVALDKMNIRKYFTLIHTNLSTFDETGKLTIQAFHPDKPSCKFCPNNFCKGRAFNELYPAVSRTTIFVGDGKPDFCVSMQLGKNDHALIRKGRSFERVYESSRRTGEDKLMATAHFWIDGNDLLEIFRKIL
jgi:2,3-diketo-5-methylthio-1-phosphopentane phosphatase